MPLNSDFILGATSATVAVLVYKIYQLFQSPDLKAIEKVCSKPLPAMGDDTKITIWGFEGEGAHPSLSLGITDDSNYVMRVEFYLRLIKKDYVKAESQGAMENPRGKLPFANLNGTMMDDSSAIISALRNIYDDPDEHLTEDQLNTGHLIRELLFGSLYWVLLHQNFDTPTGRQYFREDMRKLPPIVRDLVCAMVFRNMHASMHGSGVGRRPHAEIVKRGQADVRCLAHVLGKQKYFFGDKPTSYDTDVYAWLVLLFYSRAQVANPWVEDIKKECANLVEHTDRMRQLLFPELNQEIK